MDNLVNILISFYFALINLARFSKKKLKKFFKFIKQKYKKAQDLFEIVLFLVYIIGAFIISSRMNNKK